MDKYMYGMYICSYVYTIHYKIFVYKKIICDILMCNEICEHLDLVMLAQRTL